MSEIEIIVASAIVHADELMDNPNIGLDHAGQTDRNAFKGLMAVPAVREWLAGLEKSGVLPLRRDGVSYK